MKRFLLAALLLLLPVFAEAQKVGRIYVQGGSGQGGVESWNSRVGDVIPQAGDYQFNLIGGTAAPTQGGTGLVSYNLGDLLYGSAPDTLSALGIGTEGYSLTVQNGLPVWTYRTLSAGLTIMPNIVDNGDGTVDIGAGEVSLYSTPTHDGPLRVYALAPAAAVPITPGVTNYIIADYNGGTPIYDVTTSVSDINESDVVPVATTCFVPTPDTVHILGWDSLGEGLSNKLHKRLVKTNRFARESGLELSEVATRKIKFESGVLWIGAVERNITGFTTGDPGTDTKLWYHSGGNWTRATITQYDNTQYDDGTDLQPLSNNKYAVNWVFVDVDENHQDVCVVLGRGDYTLAEAQVSQVPPTPPGLSSMAMLIGRIIVMKNDATATDIDSAFEQVFTAESVSNHADLTNLDYASSGHTGFVQLQAATPGSQQTGHLNLTGTGIFGRGLFGDSGGWQQVSIGDVGGVDTASIFANATYAYYRTPGQSAGGAYHFFQDRDGNGVPVRMDKLLAGNGSAANPSITFESSPGFGLFVSSVGSVMDLAVNSTTMARWSINGEFLLGNFQLSSDKNIGWGAGIAGTGASDVTLARGGVGILDLTDGGIGAGKLRLGGTTSYIHTGFGDSIGFYPAGNASLVTQGASNWVFSGASTLNFCNGDPTAVGADVGFYRAAAGKLAISDGSSGAANQRIFLSQAGRYIGIGEETASHVRLASNSAGGMNLRLGDDTGYATLAAGATTVNGVLHSTARITADTDLLLNAANNAILLYGNPSNIDGYRSVLAGFASESSDAFGASAFFLTAGGTTSDLGLKRHGAGIFKLTNAGATDYFLFDGPNLLMKLGGTTSSFPALGRNGTYLTARLADNSGYASFYGQSLRLDTFGATADISIHAGGGGGAAHGIATSRYLTVPTDQALGWSLTSLTPNLFNLIYSSSLGWVYAEKVGSGIGSISQGRATVKKTQASSPYAIQTTDSGLCLTNSGAIGAVVFSLPAAQATATAMRTYTFYKDANQTFTITANTGDTIRVADTETAAAGSITLDTVGSSVTLQEVDATQWVATVTSGDISISGTPVGATVALQAASPGTAQTGNINVSGTTITGAMKAGTGILVKESNAAEVGIDYYQNGIQFGPSNSLLWGSVNAGGGYDLGLTRSAVGTMNITNGGATDYFLFDGPGLKLKFGGTTGSYPMLKRSGAGLHVRLADDTLYSTLSTSAHTILSNDGVRAVQLEATLNGGEGGGSSQLYIPAPVTVDPNKIIGWGNASQTYAGFFYDISSRVGAIVAANSVTAGSNLPRALIHSHFRSEKTSNYDLHATLDSNTFLTNGGAAGAVAFTLPAATVNDYEARRFTFYKDANQTFTITANTGDTIRVANTVTAAAGSITLDTVGSSITLQEVDATQWVAVATAGDISTSGVPIVTATPRYATTTKTGNYTATSTDYFIFCNAASGGFTITLPAAATSTGQVLVVKKTDITANPVTIDGNASETIDGALNQIITDPKTSISIVSDGSGWQIH